MNATPPPRFGERSRFGQRPDAKVAEIHRAHAGERCRLGGADLGALPEQLSGLASAPHGHDREFSDRVSRGVAPVAA